MPISKMAAASVSAILLSAPGFVHTSSAQTSRPDFCSRTARAAQTACENDVRDNFWTTVGRCLNISSEVDRTTCIDEARTARTEAGEECAAQFRARIDLCGDVGEAPYDPEFVPANFVNPLEIGRSIAPNRFFPLVPGSKWTYRSKTETVTVEVLGKVEHILGVPCTVVRDIVRQNGKIVEDTIDWHAQQTDGTVWYCGELSQEFEDGELVSLEGSWKAGRDLARPGVIMQAAPHVGDVYRQEFALGDAEDAAQNRSITGSATVPAASCSRNCVVIREFTPLEPDANELKYYAPNIGRILSVDLRTGERLELVRYQIP